MDLLLGYAAGLLTLINPCVLPVLPIVLATAIQADKRGPLALAAGMSLAFVTLGIGVATLGYALGIREETVARAAAVMMIGFGLILLVPRFSAGFATATAGVSTRADSQMDTMDRSGLKGQFLGGMLLGAVWSPCVGPTLGGAIGLASQGQSLWLAGGIMFAFAMGISTIILALGYGARSVIMKRQAVMRKIADKSRPVMGVVFILVGVAILTNFQQIIEGWIVQNLPVWLIDFSVTI
ncbi:cytochrome c biogenesis CcdA family protein [Profundibacter sp.]|uniref:cytochrome c biogenesis CcdA family protein n=1 Tax=Profundibacter sp. TaxID=3101071 RepID=UPI003D0B9971